MTSLTRDPLSLRFLAAAGDLARLQSYVRRGREFQEASDAHLTGLWHEGMRAWAADVGVRPAQLDDAEAELSLRGVELPDDLAQDEIAAVIEGAEAVLAGRA